MKLSLCDLTYVSVSSYTSLIPSQGHLVMQKEEAEKIQKAAEDACYDATFEIHRMARQYNTSVVVEIDGVPVETQPLTDAELRVHQAKIRKCDQK